MAGLLTLFFIRDPTFTPHTITCHLPSAQDNSAWSIAFTPRYCPHPFLVVSSNTHRVFYVTLGEGDHRIEGATVSVGDHVHGHNIPSTDVDSSGQRVASGSIDRRVRVMEGEPRGRRREGGGEASPSSPSRLWMGQWGTEWVWAVRWFPLWCVKRERRWRWEQRWTERRIHQQQQPEERTGSRGLRDINRRVERAQGYLDLLRDLLDRVADGFIPGEGARRGDVINDEERQGREEEEEGEVAEEEGHAENEEDDEDEIGQIERMNDEEVNEEEKEDQHEAMEEEEEEEEREEEAAAVEEEEEVDERESDEEFYDAHSMPGNTPPPRPSLDNLEGTAGQHGRPVNHRHGHDSSVAISLSNPSAPSSSSTPSAPSSESSSSSPTSPSDLLSDLLLYSNSRTLYLIRPPPNARVLCRIPNPTSHLHLPHLRDVERNSFLLTIPPLSLIVLGSPSCDRVNLWRVVKYEGGDEMLEAEMELPLIRRRCGVKGVEVSQVEEAREGQVGGGVWILYILWEDGHLAAFQLSRAIQAEEDWEGNEAQFTAYDR